MQQRIKRAPSAWLCTLSLSVSMTAYAEGPYASLQEFVDDSSTILLSLEEPVFGFSSSAYFVIELESESNASLQMPALSSVEDPVSIVYSIDGEVLTFTPAMDESDSYTISYYPYDTEIADLWGQAVSDQLFNAFSEGLLSVGEDLVVNTVDESMVFELDRFEGDYPVGDITINTKEALQIPDNVLTNISGGWQGETAPVSEDIEMLTNVTLKNSFLSVMSELPDLTDKDIVLPFVADIQTYYEEESMPYYVHDLISFDEGENTTAILDLTFDVNITSTSIELTVDGYTFEITPIEAVTESAWTSYVRAYEGNEFILSFISEVALIDGSADDFANELVTDFPFMYSSNWYSVGADFVDEDGIPTCDSLWGHVFNSDGTIEYGIYCEAGYGFEFPSEDSDEVWHWETEGSLIHHSLTSTFYDRSRLWVPLSRDQAGRVRILDFSYLTSKTEFYDSGYMVIPRISVLQLIDASKYEEYQLGGYDGDNDSDGIADSVDTDDDNDGLPDLYEARYGLDHLLAADADYDLDADSLTNMEEYTLGTNPNDPDTDDDGVLDGFDAAPLDASVFATDGIVDVLVIDDVSGDNLQDYVLIYTDSQGYASAEVINTADGSVLNTLSWTNVYINMTAGIYPDINGNGAPEIGVFGLIASTNSSGVTVYKPRLRLRDSLSGALLVTHNWVANWENVSIVQLGDLSGDGVPDIGLQGRFKQGQRPQLIARDIVTGDKLNTFGYPNMMSHFAYTQLGDMDGDGTGEIGMFGILSRNGKVQIKVASGVDSNVNLPAYNFGDKWTDVSWHSLHDINNDGIEDFGLFGIRRDDGRPQLITKSGASKKGSLGIYAWSSNMVGASFMSVEDISGDGAPDFAAAGFRTDSNRYQMLIKDGQDRNSTVAIIGWPGNWDNTSFHEVGDQNEDGITDYALFGRNISSNDWELVFKGADGKPSGSINLGDNWEGKPELNVLSGDDRNILMAAGLDATGKATIITH